MGNPNIPTGPESREHTPDTTKRVEFISTETREKVMNVCGSIYETGVEMGTRALPQIGWGIGRTARAIRDGVGSIFTGYKNEKAPDFNTSA